MHIASAEEATPPISGMLLSLRAVTGDPGEQHKILAARDDVERVQLKVFHRLHRPDGAFTSGPAASGPQALAAEDEAAGNVLGGDRGSGGHPGMITGQNSEAGANRVARRPWSAGGLR